MFTVKWDGTHTKKDQAVLEIHRQCIYPNKMKHHNWHNTIHKTGIPNGIKYKHLRILKPWYKELLLIQMQMQLNPEIHVYLLFIIWIYKYWHTQ